jgi:hypothetical protein
MRSRGGRRAGRSRLVATPTKWIAHPLMENSRGRLGSCRDLLQGGRWWEEGRRWQGRWPPSRRPARRAARRRRGPKGRACRTRAGNPQGVALPANLAAHRVHRGAECCDLHFPRRGHLRPGPGGREPKNDRDNREHSSRGEAGPRGNSSEPIERAVPFRVERAHHPLGPARAAVRWRGWGRAPAGLELVHLPAKLGGRFSDEDTRRSYGEP